MYVCIYNVYLSPVFQKKPKFMDAGFKYGCGTETDSAPSSGPNTAPFVISLFDDVTEMEPTSHTFCCFYKQDRIERVKYMSPAATPKWLNVTCRYKTIDLIVCRTRWQICSHFTTLMVLERILRFVDLASLYNLVNKSNSLHNSVLIYLFITLLYTFRASMCPSSGENCCIYVTLVFVTLYGWRQVYWLDFTPTSRPDATHTQWQIPVSHRYSNFFPDDGHVDAWNM